MLRPTPFASVPRPATAARARARAVAVALACVAARGAAAQTTPPPAGAKPPGAATPTVDTRTEPRPARRVTRRPAVVTAPAKPGAKSTLKPAPKTAPAATPAKVTVAMAAKAEQAIGPAAAATKPLRPTVPLATSLARSDSARGSAPAVAGTTLSPAAFPPGDSVPGPGPVSPTVAPAPLPADPNIPGAPNVAGRISGRLAHDAVLAPIAATVGPGRGPEVVHLQVLLDAARFSPGAVSGVWNENTVYALRAFRAAAQLPPGDSADADVVERLERRVGARQALTEYTITAADARGPFRRLPSGMYAQAKLDCLCYQSLSELLGERFHSTVELLRALNPDVDLSRATPGTRIVVPNVERGAPPPVARLVVDKRESSMRGLDARGGTRFYLPVTVGSPGLPSPSGRYKVVSATPLPRYHYDPVVLGEARGVARDALLPPGPNSPVGVLWAQLSRPHVGLHGTPYPEEVGYTMSHGCVRMANWDARWVTPLLRSGLVVDFK